MPLLWHKKKLTKALLKLTNEPTTIITDLVIAIFGFYCAHFLQSLYFNSQMEVHKYFSFYFLSIAIGASFGSVYHAVETKFHNFRSGLWKMIMICMVLSSVTLLLAIIFFSISSNDSSQKFLQILSYGVIFFSTIKIFYDDDIKNAAIIYYPISFISAVVMFLSWYHNSNMDAKQILIGLIISLFGTSFVITRISLHKHFNHNDLFHVFQIIGMYFIFVGSIKILDF